MSIRVAVIGAGVMGTDHARIIAGDLPGVTLRLVCDASADRARRVADDLGVHHATTDALATVSRPDVDAVLIASPDDTHAPLTIAAIAAGKPVLCEKPLAPTAADCLAVIAAEARTGRQLIQTGFMRRFDPSYREMKAALADGTLGAALMMHNFHRNVAAPGWFGGDMAISNSAPHEFDICRYMLGTEYRSISAFRPATTASARAVSVATETAGHKISLETQGDSDFPPFKDRGKRSNAISPVFMVLETTAGQLVTIEINNNAAYGYDVRGELVGERGSIFLARPVHATYNSALRSATHYPEDWRPRFAEAYRLQDKAWLESVNSGTPSPAASNAWDGYDATRVAEAGVTALATGARTAIDRVEMPALYASDAR